MPNIANPSANPSNYNELADPYFRIDSHESWLEFQRCIPELVELGTLRFLRFTCWYNPNDPPEITDWSFLLKFSRLEGLEFHSWNWAITPREIEQLTHLKKLQIKDCRLARIPSELFNLHKLKQLDVSSNQITDLPSQLFNLHQLEYLDISSNQITDLPPEIGNLKQITYLDIAFNPISSLPGEMGQLTNLRIFSLYFKPAKITKLPPEMSNCINLEEIYGIMQLLPIPYHLAVKWTKLVSDITIALPPEMSAPDIDHEDYSYFTPPKFIVYPIEDLFQDLLAGRPVSKKAYRRMFNGFNTGMKTHVMNVLPRDHPFLVYLQKLMAIDTDNGYSIQL
ncbi:MAG: leucine-rich repeat domain-containing protein [Promethearchaeota archaeon]